MTYLNHDHRERENVRFLAICPFIQEFWRSPSHGVAVLSWGASDGIQVLSDFGKAEVRDAGFAGAVHEDV